MLSKDTQTDKMLKMWLTVSYKFVPDITHAEISAEHTEEKGKKKKKEKLEKRDDDSTKEKPPSS